MADSNDNRTEFILDGEQLLPVPCPSSSALDFRPYAASYQGRLAIFESSWRWLTEEECAWLEESKKHDSTPPWEKSFVVSPVGIAQLSTEATANGRKLEKIRG